MERLEDRCLLSGGFAQVNLASDVPGLARVTDPNLINPWGVAFSPTGPFWFADNGSGVSDLLDGRGQPVPLVVAVPSAAHRASTPTGTVFNGGPGFAVLANGVSAPSRFLFAGEDGTISGWSALVDPTRALRVVDNSSAGADYTGLALAADPAGQTFLYAADFGRGTVDVFDQQFRSVLRPGSFQDPNLPDGFAPFNVQNVNGLLFVTYARQGGDRRDDVAGAGNGFIDVYTPGGDLVRRFASGGALDSPWGVALAPAGFGLFGGAVLVGNNGDGRISAYDPANGVFLGQLADNHGVPITIPNLWALTFGNGHAGGDAQTLFFAAGVHYDKHGLFGAIQAPGRRGADTAGPGGFDPNAPGEPGDYPLPPSSGPAFRDGSQDLPVAVSDLLPLRESSLVLAPTLSAVAQPGRRIESPVQAAPTLAGSFGPASNTIALAGAAGNARPAGDAAALNTFLDLNASPGVVRSQATEPRPGSYLATAGAPGSPAADGHAGADVLLPEDYVRRLEAPASEEQGPGALPPSGQPDERLAGAPSQSRAESADQRAAGSRRMELKAGRGLASLMHLLVVVSIPVLWAYWTGQEPASRRSHEGLDRG